MTEVQSFIALCTSHLTKETADYLTVTNHEDWPYAGGPYAGYGWFFYAHDENNSLIGEQSIPADLWAVMTYARKQGCSYVLFDRDADTTEELPTYDW